MPTISYFINFATRMFDIFTSYMGFGVFTPEEEDPEGGDELVQG